MSKKIDSAATVEVRAVGHERGLSYKAELTKASA